MLIAKYMIAYDKVHVFKKKKKIDSDRRWSEESFPFVRPIFVKAIS